MQFFIGTSGWQYDHWSDFYKGVPKKDWLKHFSEEFDSVEVNATFYGSIKPSTFSRWYDQTPHDFRFSLKGNRYITHLKRLKDPERPVGVMYERCKALKHKLGCFLWQLPPSMEKDISRLKNFCSALDNRKNNVIEFRHGSWFCGEVFDILEDSHTGFCSVLAPGLPDTLKTTNNLAYVRFHGKDSWYADRYSGSELKSWMKRIKRLKAKYNFIYFNNDARGFAVENAKQFKDMRPED